ncbi:MAG: DUF86 domain-containing protein [Pseudomonadota bacterium]
MADDVLLNKAASIERCLNRIDEEYRGHEQEFETNFTRQDALMMNLLRASETSIDAAMHIVRVRKLGLPQESKDAFKMLALAGIVPPELSVQLQKMIGFCNIAIHNYAQLDLNIVRSIIEQQLGDFRELARLLIRIA